MCGCRKTLGLIALPILLASCAAGGGGSFCTTARPIYVEVEDVFTTATVRMILAHNETGARLCGWQPVRP